jgi:hypothetical protein
MVPTPTARSTTTCFLAAWLSVGTSMLAQAPAQKPQPEGTPPAEEILTVRMIDAVDSSRDAPGREYRAVVTSDLDGGFVPILKGSPAKVTLVKTQSGWVTQLVSVNINGADTDVTSSSATVTGLVPGAVGSAVGAVTSMFGGFGKKKANSASDTAASGERVSLLPGTEVRFQLGPAVQKGATVPGPRGAPTPVDGRRGAAR